MLKVRRSFSVGKRTLRRGQLVDADDPAVEGREHLFIDPAEEVEQATAAPGERRRLSRPDEYHVRDNQPQPAATPEEEESGGDELPCPECDRTFKNAGGLASHQRAHQRAK